MSWFKAPADPFPQWRPFPEEPSAAVAEKLGLGAGDGISVRFAGREVPMDLMVVHLDCFVVKDPDDSTHLHSWSEAVRYWKRIGQMKSWHR